MLGSGQGCSWGTGECVSGAWGCFGVFSGVLGLFEGVGGLRGVSGSLLPSFPFNVRKSQMRILNFFSRPEDPKCLKYQNVPNLGSFWAIGKPWKRFQSWDIRIYFIPVPNDHTVQKDEKITMKDSLTKSLKSILQKKLLWVHFIFIVSPSTAQKPKQQRWKVGI